MQTNLDDMLVAGFSPQDVMLQQILLEQREEAQHHEQEHSQSQSQDEVSYEWETDATSSSYYFQQQQQQEQPQQQQQQQQQEQERPERFASSPFAEAASSSLDWRQTHGDGETAPLLPGRRTCSVFGNDVSDGEFAPSSKKRARFASPEAVELGRVHTDGDSSVSINSSSATVLTTPESFSANWAPDDSCDAPNPSGSQFNCAAGGSSVFPVAEERLHSFSDLAAGSQPPVKRRKPSPLSHSGGGTASETDSEDEGETRCLSPVGLQIIESLAAVEFNASHSSEAADRTTVVNNRRSVLASTFWRFRQASDEEIRRMMDESGALPTDAVETLVSKMLRLTHASTGIQNHGYADTEVRRVMTLGQFSERDAIRALRIRDELLTVGQAGETDHASVADAGTNVGACDKAALLDVRSLVEIMIQRVRAKSGFKRSLSGADEPTRLFKEADEPKRQRKDSKDDRLQSENSSSSAGNSPS